MSIENFVQELRKLMRDEPVNVGNIERVFHKFSQEDPRLLGEIFTKNISPTRNHKTILEMALQTGDLDFIEMLVGFDAPIDQKILELARTLLSRADSPQEEENYKKIVAFLNSREKWKKYDTKTVNVYGDNKTVFHQVSLNRVMRLIEQAEQERVQISDSAKKKDVFLLCGRTQTGKSTLGNYLSGSKYQKSIDRDTLVTSATRIGGASETLKTGGSRRSETLRPKECIVADEEGHILIDMPGLEESRGIEEAISIAASTKLLLKDLHERNVKIRGVLFLCALSCLREPTFGRYPSMAFRISQMAKSRETSQNLLFVTTIPYAENATAQCSHVIENLRGFSREAARNPADPGKREAKRITDVMLNTANRIAVGDVTTEAARAEISRCLSTIPALPQHDSFTVDELYGNFTDKLIEAMNHAAKQYKALVDRVNATKAAIEENQRNIDKAKNQLVIVNDKLRSLQKEKPKFDEHGNKQNQKRRKDDIEGLQGAMEGIEHRLKSIDIELRELQEEQERLEQDETVVELPSPIEASGRLEIKTKQSVIDDEEKSMIWESDSRGFSNISLKHQYPHPIRSWVVAEKSKHCQFIPGRVPSPPIKLLDKAKEYITPERYKPKFTPIKGKWKDETTYEPLEDGVKLQQELFEQGKLEGKIRGTKDCPRDHNYKISFRVSVHQKYTGATKESIDHIKKKYSALQQKLEEGQRCLTWTTEELAYCNQSLQELQGAKAAFDEKLQTEERELQARKDEIQINTPRLEQEQKGLEQECKHRQLELDVNNKYFVKIAKWVEELGLKTDDSPDLAYLVAHRPVLMESYYPMQKSALYPEVSLDPDQSDSDISDAMKEESRKMAEAQGEIGPREISGWTLKDVEDLGNCFYDAVAHQMQLIRHGFLSKIRNGTLPRDSLRLRIQGERFRDREWADDQIFEGFVTEFNLILAIVDTRNPEAGFVCYYQGEDREIITNTGSMDLPDKPIIRLAATGNHFLSVVSHPDLLDGCIYGATHLQNGRIQDATVANEETRPEKRKKARQPGNPAKKVTLTPPERTASANSAAFFPTRVAIRSATTTKTPAIDKEELETRHRRKR